MNKYVKSWTNNALNSSFIGGVGYVGAYVVAPTAMAGAGSFGAMLGVGLVGGAALYVPTAMLKATLKYFNALPDVLSELIDIAFRVGSAAAGAAIFGLAIQPFLMCAAIGVAIVLMLDATFGKSSENKAAETNVEPRNRRFGNQRLFSDPLKREEMPADVLDALESDSMSYMNA